MLLINLLKNDFNRIYSILKMWNDKIPMWAIVIYYVVMLPIGILLLVPALIWQWYIIEKMFK